MPTTQSDAVVTDGPAPAAAAPKRRVPSLVSHVLVAAVTLLVGFGIGLLFPQQPGHPGDTSPEAGFIRDMSLHHAQAVDMGMVAYAKATNGDVRTIGMDIALTQHGQVNIMQTWLKGWGLDPNGSQPLMAWMPGGTESLQDGLMPGMATPQQMEELRQAEGKQVDILFLTMMRQHHLGGIHMAQEILKLSKDPDVTEIAETMVSTQQYEITAMTQLLEQIQAS
ncbi:DUF305 domain-containing protein [Actinoplanes sp. G11-F43]|uniref:DUF305 domain-containing protein n=1 Tax=Actinoplanes sp. G11-F43 TaxID=3424130 RepID=UPI003D34519B